MSDKKISQLPASTTPLAGTEELAVVQSGNTKKVSVANLTAGRQVAAGQVNVNLVSASNFAQLTVGNRPNATTYGTPAYGAGIIRGFTATPSADQRGTLNLECVSKHALDRGAMLTFSQNYSSLVDGLEFVGAAIKAGAASASNTSQKTYLSFYVNDDNGSSLNEAMRITDTKNVSIANGNLVIGTSGKGIDFSADSSAAGMTSELLDDYEEGTWTPAFISSGGSALAQTSTGTYTKIGNVVHFSFKCTFEAGASPPRTDVYYDTPFPFQSNPTSQNFGCAAVIGGDQQFPVVGLTSNRLRVYVTASVTTFTGFGVINV